MFKKVVILVICILFIFVSLGFAENENINEKEVSFEYPEILDYTEYTEINYIVQTIVYPYSKVYEIKSPKNENLNKKIELWVEHYFEGEKQETLDFNKITIKENEGNYLSFGVKRDVTGKSVLGGNVTFFVNYNFPRTGGFINRKTSIEKGLYFEIMNEIDMLGEEELKEIKDIDKLKEIIENLQQQIAQIRNIEGVTQAEIYSRKKVNFNKTENEILGIVELKEGELLGGSDKSPGLRPSDDNKLNEIIENKNDKEHILILKGTLYN